ncbi:topoisomerase IV [Oscillospiraceae bacterium HV4-5-C5C]|nr:topoisomerase IV [Oscillospiraceae bacterium HV4-5-C5C]
MPRKKDAGEHGRRKSHKEEIKEAARRQAGLSGETLEPAVIVQQPITETLEKNYMPYAMSVIVSRAIPEIDGFKPAHRKLLYTMYKMGLLNGARTKSANVVGQTMKLNPHGDQAIYDTLVRLTRGNGSLLHPYIDSKGNFGKQYSRDMQCAAPRYTEVRLEKLCEELFRHIDFDTVDFINNYDGTMQEPTLLPATFPSVLLNQNQGIAVGMASNIAPFNLRELCRATAAYIDDPSVDLLPLMPAPDFPGGALLLYDQAQMQAIYQTGRGSFKLRARYRLDTKNNLIEIYEIPYSTTVEQIIDDLAGLVKSGKVRDITDVRDETDLEGLKLAIECKRNTDMDALMSRLYLQTNLEASFSCNFNILVNGSPRVMGVKQILGEWLSFRRNCVRREVAFELQRKQDRLHLLQGLEKILLDIDKAIQIIRQTEKEEEVVPNLCRGFSIDVIQADYVAEIKLRNLNREYILKRTADMKQLEQDIRELEQTLGERERIDARIKVDLQRVSDKYGQDRRTEILHAAKAETLTRDDLIEDYRLRLFLTHDGYLKKLALTSLRSAGDLKTKEDDYIIQSVEGSNKQELILFSDRQTCYKMMVHEIADQKPSDLGEYLTNLLGLAADERIIYLLFPDQYEGDLMFAFANGKVSRTPLKNYETKTRRRRLLNAYGGKAPLVGMSLALTDRDYVLRSDDGKVCLFSSALVSLMSSRSGNGIQVMTLRKDRKIVAFAPAEGFAVEEPEHYRVRKIPARGLVMKEELLEARQMGFEDV